MTYSVASRPLLALLAIATSVGTASLPVHAAVRRTTKKASAQQTKGTKDKEHVDTTGAVAGETITKVA